jgi:hypothetical protein
MVHLSSPLWHPADFFNAFSQSPTTMALYHCNIEWFEICFRKPIPKGPSSSYLQFQIYGPVRGTLERSLDAAEKAQISA